MTSRTQDAWLADWAGANATMIKPVDPFELSRRVRDLVGEPARPHGGSGGTARQVAAALGEDVGA